MTEKEEKGRSRRRYPSIVWPVILIAAGVMFLLSNLGFVDVNVWELWRLWPALLILIGLDILIGGRSFWGNLIVLILALAVVTGVVILLVASPTFLGLSPDAGIVQTIREPLDAAEAADLYVGFGAGELQIERLVDSTFLVEGRLELATQRRPGWSIDRSDERATMSLRYEEGVSFEGWNWRGGDHWSLRLSPEVTLRLEVDVGAGEATLDLEGLDVQELEVQAGASQTTVRFPRRGSFPGQIRGGAGTLVLEIPEEMAARVQIERGLAPVNASDRYERQGDLYETPDWSSNPNRVDLEVHVGVGLVTIREP